MKKFVLAITGGGTGALVSMLQDGGASKWLLEANVPYSKEAIIAYTGYKPEHFCSRDQALNLAVQSYLRAHKYAKPDDATQLIGIGATSRLHTGYLEREGRVNETWVALHSNIETKTWHIVFTSRNRREQEHIVATIIQEAVEYGYVSDEIYKLMSDGETIVPMVQRCPKELIGLFNNENYGCYIYSEGQVSGYEHSMLFPGSFNPLHEGHIAVAEKAYEITGKLVFFEICILNTDKPALDYLRVQERIEQIQARLRGKEWFGGVVVSNTPYFIEKGLYTPFGHFIIGMDTANRISEVDEDKLVDYGAKFLVFPRERVRNTRTFAECFQVVNDFVPMSISSTQIREAT